MTLSDLLVQVATNGGIRPTRFKDFKTSIRYLANALDKATPEQCYVDDFLTANWKTCLNQYLGRLGSNVSPHTIRNTRNQLSRLFHQAHDLGIIVPFTDISESSDIPKSSDTRLVQRQKLRENSPYQRHVRQPTYALSVNNWPTNIQDAWEQYCRKHSLRVRATTLKKREDMLRCYLGFFHNIGDQPITTWDELFDHARLDRFVRWHSQKIGVRISTRASGFASILRTLAVDSKHPNTPMLREYCGELPTPEPMHDKQHHWFTLRELEQVGLSILEDARRAISSQPNSVRHPGLRRALLYQKGLLLRLLVRVPLRQRNIREMKLHRNLYQDHNHQWQLEFKGDELKAGQRHGKINVFRLNLHEHAPEFIPALEEFLDTYRPKFPNADSSPLVFLTRGGRPFRGVALHQELQLHVFARTGKRFYPHLIRTIWATEFIAKTGDFTTAAYMLNDRVETVLQQYHEILEKDHRDKAKVFLSTIFSPTNGH